MDGLHLVLTNAAGARAMGATGIGIALERSYSVDHAFAGQIVRIAAQLPDSGEMRLERLREFARASSTVLLAQARRLSISGTDLVLLTTVPSGASSSLAAARQVVEALPIAALIYQADGAVAVANMAARAVADIPFDRLIGEAAASFRQILATEGRASIDLVTGAFAVSSIVENGLMLGVFSTQPAMTEPVAGLRLVTNEEAVQDGMVSTSPHSIPAAVSAPWLSSVSRLVWRTNALGLHVEEPKGLADVLNHPGLSVVGKSWPDLATELGAEVPAALVEALARREVWSGIALILPRPDADEAIQLMLSAVPASTAGQFDGFRGFAIASRTVRPAVQPLPIETEVPELPAVDVQPSEPADHSVPMSAEEQITAIVADVTRSEPDSPAPKAGSPDEDQPRPTFTVHEKPANVFALRNGQDSRRGLSPLERHAFREIAKALNARVEGDDEASDTPPEDTKPAEPPAAPAGSEAPLAPVAASFLPHVESVPSFEPVMPEPVDDTTAPQPVAQNGADGSVFGILDSVQLGLVVHRGNHVLYANRPLLDWTGYHDMQELEEAGGLARLFAEEQTLVADETQERPDAILIVGKEGQAIPVAARLARIPWEGDTALMFALRRVEVQPRQVEPEEDGHSVAETTLAEVKSRLDEVEGILDTATDGIVIVHPNGQIESLNRSAEALFGYESGEVKSKPFVTLFAPESHGVAQDYLEGLSSNGVASILNDGREIVGRVKQGGLIPLYMTLGRIGSSDRQKFAAVFRDMTQWKKAEEELLSARRMAEKASSHKSDFLAKISHEIRTPLNAIIGFSEVMMEERFGPIGNQRYKDYLRDIHLSGGHVLSLINDLLDLSKIEAGKLELNFASVDLNAVVQQCVAIMQPQANREKVIIRSSLAHHLPNVVADDRSIRQVVLNLLTNSVKFTPPGGQVIISTAFSDQGEAVLRVRDTGIGMTEAEIKVALEPFRQITTSQTEQTKGTGLGLPLTKALVEANRASFGISSHPGQGTMVEIVFPATRVLAE